MFLPLSRKIPLRNSTSWGRFASVQSLPRIYGTATIEPVPYDDTGRLFVAADHVVRGIPSVTTDGTKVTAYRFYHAPDTTGKTVAFLELQTPITIGTTKLAATVEGLMHPITGLLMTNPADVAHDLLQWATGKTLDRGRFAVFASACQRYGLEINGALNNSGQTLRATLDSAMDSACAAWSSADPDFGTIWGDTPGRAVIIPPLSVNSVVSASSLDAIATVVTVRFGYDWQAGDYTGSVTYTAPEQVKQYGNIERVIEAPFCATGRQACLIAEYWCQRLSVPQYTANIETDRSNRGVQIASRISLNHPHLPGGSVDNALIINREYNPETGSLSLTALLPSAVLPVVELSGYSGKFTQQASSGTQVTIGPDSIDLILTGSNGVVLGGAIAVLDGTAAATADASGRVVFTGVSAGSHTVEVRATGYEPFVLQVTV